MIRTQANDDLISALLHGILIIPPIELSKRRKASSTHPVLEVFVLVEFGNVVECIAVRETLLPVWWRLDL